MSHFFGMEGHPEVEQTDPPVLYYDSELGRNALEGTLMIAVPSTTIDQNGQMINPDIRTVTQGDIDRLNLPALLTDGNGNIRNSAVLGNSTENVYVYGEDGILPEYANGMTFDDYQKDRIRQAYEMIDKYKKSGN